MPVQKVHGYTTIGILIFLLAVSGIWYATSPTRYGSEAGIAAQIIEEKRPLYESEYIVVNLSSMTVELKNATGTLETFPIISKGKPGSYYETIGGAYANDYKERNHFSSIGHVYMPYSVHVFGNYFLHGIPYYPDGTKVSSTYSGGCVRLDDESARRVYEFTKRGTPIVITGGNEGDFASTKAASTTLESIDMTRFMSATVSLEVLTQDNDIVDTDGITVTTRRNILPRLIKDGDDSVSRLYTNAVGKNAYIDYMNQKARSLGLTNTVFTSVDMPVHTTEEDQARFADYISNYKSYLIALAK